MQNLPKKVRSKKLNAKVDLTAMVSVSFLLIIFFMVVGELSKPKIIDLSLPSKEWENKIVCGMGISDRLITVLLDKNDKIIIYQNLLPYSTERPKKLQYGKEGIRKELHNTNKAILKYSAAIGRPDRGAIVIIKPCKKSSFKNLVDILDEMAIAKIETYSIVNEFTSEEAKLLASK
ncbi:biopolymer transporter ExbD [Flavobacterium sp. WG21]|uniref:ExbD/TolR family protein n=1 Tax=Flavobacterium sp. WG21 TaxID=1229487 RepID=UPI00034DDCB7|nr:biopolymer transporter ExbD [Flavobacterium sp. WG21]